jgi:putative transposase
VKLVVSDAHEGIKAAVSKVLCATWQRCRVGLLKNPLPADSIEQVLIRRGFHDAWSERAGSARVVHDRFASSVGS